MSGPWVAGCTRAKALASRRLGARAARDLAARPSLEEAVVTLSATPYGRGVHPGQSLEEAQHAVAETLLWNVRVLAGWLPGEGADMLRALVGWFEITNVDEHLQSFEGAVAPPYFALGGLATAWPRLAATGSVAGVRDVMATSRWGDPGESTHWAIRLRLQASWAARVYEKVTLARPWVADAAALLVSRVLLLEDRSLPVAAAAALHRSLPELDLARSVSSGPVDYLAFVAHLPSRTQELLAEVAEAAGARSVGRRIADGADEYELLARAFWRAEARWWSLVERDALALLGASGFGGDAVVGSAGVLAADAWRVRGALAASAYATSGLETFDALA